MRKNPKRKVVTEYIEEPEESVPAFPAEPVVDEDEVTIRNVMAPFVGEREVEVKIYRQRQNQESYCFTTGPQFTEEEIINHPRGGFGNFVARVLINGDLRRRFPVPIEPPQSGVNSVTSQPQSDVIRMLMDEIRSLRETMHREPQPMADIMQGVSALITATAQAQLQRPPAETPLDQFLKFHEALNSMKGGEDDWWKPALASVAKEAVPMLGALMQRAPTASAQQPQQSQQPQSAITGEATVPQMDIQLKMGIAFLKQKCLAGSQPELYIEVICDNSDATQYQELIHRVVTQDFSQFAALDPEISKPPYEHFFRSIFDGLRSEFAPAHSVATPSAGSGGHASNTSGNGASSKNGSKKSGVR
jgi:hypothetical protein